MENEVSTSINIMIELLVISIVISFLMLFMALGKTFQADMIQTVADTQAESYATELIEAVEYGPMPVAALYGMLDRNYAAVQSVEGNVYGVEITKADDLVTLFSKKVQINLIKVNEMFKVQVVEPVR